MAQELEITPIQIADIPPSASNPGAIWRLGLPQMTANGQIAYMARYTSDPNSGAPAHSAIVTAKATSPESPQLQVRWGSLAPLDEWEGGRSPFDAPTPQFGDNITLWGINREGAAIFTSSRFGMATTQNGLGFGQADEHIVWQVKSGAIQPFAGYDPGSRVDFEFLSDSGQAAITVVGDGPDQLYVNSQRVARQDLVPMSMQGVLQFGGGFGLQGGYQFSADGQLYFQSSISDINEPLLGVSVGIYVADSLGLLSEVIREGGSYQLPDGSMSELMDLRGVTGNGYGLQTTPEGEVGFIGDGRVLVGDSNGVRAAFSPGFGQAFIDGSPRNVQMFGAEDLLIGPDGAIYFEAEAEIREIELLGQFKNYVWKMTPGEQPGAYNRPVALLAQGQVAVGLDGTDDIPFDDTFTLKDVNANGYLLLRAKLDRDHPQVNSGSDDTLVAFDADGRRTLIARQGDPILPGGSETYGGLDAARGASLSDTNDVVFSSSDFLSSTRHDTVLLASFVTRETLNFDWRGYCELDDNWHADCDVTNWHDVDKDVPALDRPGDRTGVETATLTDASVVIDVRPVHLKSLNFSDPTTPINRLTVRQPLWLADDSSIENLNLEANLTVDGKLTLTGDSVVFGRPQATIISSSSAGDVATRRSDVIVEQDARLTVGPMDTLGLRTNLTVRGSLVLDNPFLSIIRGTDPGGVTSEPAVSVEPGGEIIFDNALVSGGPIFNEGLLTFRTPTGGSSLTETSLLGEVNSSKGRIVLEPIATATLTGKTKFGGTQITLADQSLLTLEDGPHLVQPIALVDDANTHFRVQGDGTLKIKSGELTLAQNTVAAFSNKFVEIEGKIVNKGQALIVEGSTVALSPSGVLRTEGQLSLVRAVVTTPLPFPAPELLGMVELANGANLFVAGDNAQSSLLAKLNFVDGGNITIAPRAELSIAGGGSLAGGGTFLLSTDSRLEFLIGNYALEGDYEVRAIGGGTVDFGDSEIQLAGALTNDGDIVDRSSVRFTNQGKIVNLSNARYTLVGNGTMPSSSSNPFENQGILEVQLSSPAAMGAMYTIDYLDNTGQLLVSTGARAHVGDSPQFRLPTPGFRLAELTGGLWTVRDQGVLTFTSGPSFNPMTLRTIGLGARVRIEGSGQFPNITSASVGLGAGVGIRNQGELAFIDVATRTRPLQQSLFNEPTGKLFLSTRVSGTELVFANGLSLENEGRLEIDAASKLIIPGGPFESTGASAVNVINGAVSAQSFKFSGGKFGGSGTIQGLRFDNAGQLLPGNSAGTLTLEVDEFVQGPAGRIIVEVAGMTAGMEYDRLVISGTAELGGTLELQFLEGEGGGIFVPQDGAQFDFVTAAGGITGQFDQIVTPSTGLGADVSVTYETGGVMLTVLDTFLVGDYNANGAVEQADLDLVLLNWGNELADPLDVGWTDDLPEGPIDQAELDRVLLNWGNTMGTLGTASVPEPGGFLLVVCSVSSLALALRRGVRGGD